MKKLSTGPMGFCWADIVAVKTANNFIRMGIGSSSSSSGESRLVDDQTGDTYIGPTVDGKPDGHGIWTMGDGTGTYTGQFVGGVFEGHGTFVNEGQGTYEGEWHNGLRHGQGNSAPFFSRRHRHRMLNCALYTFESGVLEKTYPDGTMTRYTGQFRSCRPPSDSPF